MSTLTLTLLILAVLVISGVLLFNVFTARKSGGDVPSQPSPNLGEAMLPESTSLNSISGDIAQANNRRSAQRSSQISERQQGNEPSLGVLTPYISPEPAASFPQAPAPTDQFVDVAGRNQNISVQSNPTENTQDPSHFVQDGSIAQQHSPNIDFAQIDPDAVKNLAPQLEPTAANSLAEHSVLSADFDYLVEFALPSPQTGERLLSLTQQHRRVGAKPIAFDGLVSDGQWIVLLAGQRYVSLRAGILLANRHGPLNAMEYSDFSALMTKLAEQLDCEAPLSDLPGVVANAREVDRRCADLDAQLGINIKTASAISPDTLSQLATEAGFVERGNGRFARLDEAGATLFTLAFGDAADRLVMLLDVPRSPAHQRPWHQMLNSADSIAKRLGGELVDDTGKALPTQVWAQIEEQLLQRYWALESAGVIPGSARALRLFN